MFSDEKKVSDFEQKNADSAKRDIFNLFSGSRPNPNQIKLFLRQWHSSGLYYKHVTIVNDDSSIVRKWSFKLSDDPRVFLYDRHRFIIHAPAKIPSNVCFHPSLIFASTLAHPKVLHVEIRPLSLGSFTLWENGAKLVRLKEQKKLIFHF